MDSSCESKPRSGIAITHATPSDDTDWDQFVSNHEHGSLYHSSKMRSLIERTFNHQTHYLVAKNNGGLIEGVLPLVRLKSKIFDDYVVSIPFFTHGGALATSPTVEASLMIEGAHWAKGQGCSHLEVRSKSPGPVRWYCRQDKVAMELRLPDSKESLGKHIGKKLRAQVKRPLREGATAHFGGLDLLDDFYAVFAQNMRDLGTPVYGKNFFRELISAFQGDVRIVSIRIQGRAAAAAFLIRSGDTVEIPWASSLRKFNRISVNMMLYWEVLSSCIEDGASVFDFGRSSRNAGTYKFKRQWGAVERQLYWHYWLSDPNDMPGLTVDNPKFQVAIKMWQQMPLWFTNQLGPHLVKYLP